MKNMRWVVLMGSLTFASLMTARQGHTQSTAPGEGKLEFEVASVRQNLSSNGESYSNFPLSNGNIYRTPKAGDDAESGPGYFSARNQPMWRYIAFAYNLNGTQELAFRFNMFSGLSSTKVPKWVTGEFDASADRFDIVARAAGQPTKDEMRLMMRSLLEDRFQMAAHFETHEAPVFAMVLAKPGKMGPGLKVHPADDLCAEGSDASSAKNASEARPEVCGVLGRLAPSAPGLFKISGRGISLALLANSLPTQTGMATISKPVIDKTGLDGLYDVTLEWAGLQQDGSQNPAGPSFGEALRDQLGLKLESDKGPVEILVIDHIEHPSEN